MQPRQHANETDEQDVSVTVGDAVLQGSLAVPQTSQGIVLFAHGSGSSRFSPRNQFVAAQLQQSGLGTFLVDLLTPNEERVDSVSAELRFDIPFLGRRLGEIVDWLRQHPASRELPVGLFGASTGGGAALVAAAHQPEIIKAVVSRGGRPDLAAYLLNHALAPTLLIVGGEDHVVIELNRHALLQLAAPAKELAIIPGATHLFEEPGALEEVACLAAAWFRRHLVGGRGSAAAPSPPRSFPND